MTELFNRVGNLTIEVPNTGRGIQLDGLRFSFDIDKTSTSEPNSATFQIYNVAESRRYLFEETGSKIICRLGWAGRGVDTSSTEFLQKLKDIEICYVGEIIENGYKLDRQGADTVITVQCGTAASIIKEKTVNKSFAKGTGVETIVKDIASEAGLNVSFIPNVDLGKILNGQTITGGIKGVLDLLLGDQDLTWSIQDEEIQIVEANKSARETGVLLTPETGLLGTPTKTKEGLISFRSLLNTKIRPNEKMTIRSNLYTGIVVPIKVKYIGDFDGGEFDCVVEAQEA